MTSYGESLPDSEHLLNTRAEAILSLFPTIANFLAYRASLERDLAKKLTETTSKYRLLAIKDAGQRVGDGKGTNTLEEGYMKILEAADLDAREHLAFADALQHKGADAFSAAGARLENVRKKQHAFAGKLLAERDRVVADREASKKKYFDACETLENARQKKASAKDERQTDKATKAYDLAMDDMYIAKNQFLLDTDSANVSKSRLYNTDLPALHDDFQLLESQSILNLVHLLNTYHGVQRASLAKLGDITGMSEQAVAGISVEQDQAAFVYSHSGRKGTWEVPPDMEFEECPVWHDSAEFSTTPSSTIYLQNVKIKALARLSEISPVVESKRREVAGLRNLRDAYEKDRNLGDVGNVLENLVDSQRETTLIEIDQTELNAQIELINSTLGDDGNTSLKLHDFANKSFVTPTTCLVCEASLWGKGRMCKKCGCAVHAKCELKVPAGCGTSAGVTIQRGGSKRISSSSTSSLVSPSFSSASTSSRHSISSMPPPSRHLPPPAEPPMQTATMLYSYSAASALELTLSEGDVVSVVEDVDESGWRKVATKDGRTGLVPDSYLQLGGSLGGAGAPQHVEEGPEVLVLYDYEAAGADELSLVEGERLRLTSVGMDAGDGWAEAVKNGRKGLLPSAYIQLV